MTENKRFTFKNYDGRSCDVFKDGEELWNVDNEDVKSLVSYLNEYDEKYHEYRDDVLRLEKENEQLKQSNKDAWSLIRFIYNEIKEDGSMDWGRIQDLVEDYLIMLKRISVLHEMKLKNGGMKND